MKQSTRQRSVGVEQATGIQQAVIPNPIAVEAVAPPVETTAIDPEKNKPWYKQPAVFCIVGAILIVAVIAIVLNTRTANPFNEPSSTTTGANATNFSPTVEPSLVDTTTRPSPTTQEQEGTTVMTSEPTVATTTANPTTAPIAAPPTASPTAAPSETPPPFAFYVMGDVPYTNKEKVILENQLDEMTANRHPGSAFAVHVGDFQRWQQTSCNASAYTNFRTTLLKSPVLVLVLAGDNDYLDCPKPQDAWGIFIDTFSTIENEWDDRLPTGINTLEVNRWFSQRPELFSFVADNILFLSANLLNAPDEQVNTEEWNTRMAANVAWISQESEAAFAQNDIRGVVMFSHATPSSNLRIYYVTILEQVFTNKRQLPVLNIHGDGHIFLIDTRFSEDTNWSGFVDLQVDQGGKADPLLIEVAPLRNNVTEPLEKENEMQYIFGNGLFRVDRQNGRYPETSS